ncbi:MAG: hypothetical protein ACJA1B_001232 [Polaribacter sp.]
MAFTAKNSTAIKYNSVKKLLILTLTIIFSSFNVPAIAQQNDFIKDYLELLENSRKYLILVALEMPEDTYEYKASPESMTFSVNLMQNWFSYLFTNFSARNRQLILFYNLGNKAEKI